MTSTVKLGYELGGSHDAVEIPIRHMVVAGQTQEAGKTTTLEALIQRSGKTAIAFVTKRGEGSFAGAPRIRPYFRERADWQFVSSILEATMRERMKFERSWIIKVSKGAKTLADVHRNVKTELRSARGISEGVYTALDAYLELVVPRIASVDWAPELRLGDGLNVLDLSDSKIFPSELQSLVMRSVLERVYQSFEDVITIIPEAWEFIPQGRGSPVKLAAVELIRKGASLRNYVWLDSQDIGGVDKEILRSCPVWLLGVQRERNEIKRVLSNIPDGLAKPKPEAIATLERGQFFACYGRHSIKTYVQPAWMTDERARLVADGTINQVTAAVIDKPPPSRQVATVHVDARATPETLKALAEVIKHGARELQERDEPLTIAQRRQLNYRDPMDFPSDEDDLMSSEAITLLNRIIELLEQRGASADLPMVPAAAASTKGVTAPSSAVDEDQLFERFRARLLKDPVVLAVLTKLPEIRITEQLVTVTVDLESGRGMLAKLISEGFFDQPVTSTAVWNEWKRRWNYKGIAARAYEQCEWYATKGFFTKEDTLYQVVPSMKKNVVRA